MTRAKWLGGVLSGTVLVGVTVWASQTITDVQVETAQVTAGSIVREVLATGTLEPTGTAEVGSQVSGVVQSLPVDYDSVVHAGQVVARLDPSSYQADVQQARAALTQADADLAASRAGLDDAQIKLSQAKALAALQVVTQADLDAAVAVRDEAAAGVHAREATVSEAHTAVNQAVDNLDHTVIRSPIDGIVTERDVDVGQTLAAAVRTPVLFRIATDLTHMQVQVDIDEADVAGLAAGEPVTFDVEAYPDEIFRGTLKELRLQPVAEETTTATSTLAIPSASDTTTLVPTVVGYTAIVDVANPDERLKPGMTAEVTLSGARRDNVVRIPNRALSFRPPALVLEALGEAEPSAAGSTPADRTGAQSRELWEYDGKRFTAIEVHVGLADDRWTELVSGSIRQGDALVTRAVLRRHSRM